MSLTSWQNLKSLAAIGRLGSTTNKDLGQLEAVRGVDELKLNTMEFLRQINTK